VIISHLGNRRSGRSFRHDPASRPARRQTCRRVAEHSGHEAKREEELKELLARAKQRGIENQKRMAEEEAEKKRKREERLAMFARPDDDDDSDKDAPPKEEPPPEEPQKTDDKKDDDDDGLALV